MATDTVRIPVVGMLWDYARRTVRHFTVEGSYAQYYPVEKWEFDWAHHYDLDKPKEDVHYGALLLLIRRYDRGGPLLDAGCGDGLLEELVRPLSNSRILAFDYSHAALKRARDRNIPDCDFFYADSRTYCPSETCAAVILNESLYYLEDYLGAMQNLSRALKPDGVLIVSMFDTLVTRRIWKTLDREYVSLHGVSLRDEVSRSSWRIRVMRPRR